MFCKYIVNKSNTFAWVTNGTIIMGITTLSANTTMVIIEWIMFELARNPTIPERLYKEVGDVIGGWD